MHCSITQTGKINGLPPEHVPKSVEPLMALNRDDASSLPISKKVEAPVGSPSNGAVPSRFSCRSMEILGIDIGGSSIKGAVVDTGDGRLLSERWKIKTPQLFTPDQVADAIATLTAELKWQGPIGVGFPGVIHESRILTSDNLHKGFIDCDGGRLFSERVGLPVALINDAAAAGLSEMTFGAGRNFKGKTLLLTLGTGVGSVFFCRGVLFPCELGQLPFKGRSAEKYVASSVMRERTLSWAEWGERLSEYIGVLETIHWPELIVIGGAVSAEHSKFFKFIKCRAKMVPAEFFNDAGIVGAALWAESEIPGNPRYSTAKAML
jgi:polyphosphate glucokinase